MLRNNGPEEDDELCMAIEAYKAKISNNNSYYNPNNYYTPSYTSYYAHYDAPVQYINEKFKIRSSDGKIFKINPAQYNSNLLRLLSSEGKMDVAGPKRIVVTNLEASTIRSAMSAQYLNHIFMAADDKPILDANKCSIRTFMLNNSLHIVCKCTYEGGAINELRFIFRFALLNNEVKATRLHQLMRSDQSIMYINNANPTTYYSFVRKICQLLCDQSSTSICDAIRQLLNKYKYDFDGLIEYLNGRELSNTSFHENNYDDVNEYITKFME